MTPKYLLTFGLILAGLSACKKQDDAAASLPPATGEGAAPMPALPAIQKASSEQGAIAPSEGRTTGTTYPKQEAQIAPNAGGLISELAVDEGSRVKKGDLLFRQDARDAKLRVDQAKAALAAAQVGLRALETEKKRAEVLVGQNAMNRAQWDQIEARYDGAKVQVDQAQVGLAMAQKYLEDMTVRAPFAGVVTKRLKTIGEMATMMPPTVVLILQDQSTLELRFSLPEQALARVKPGDRVRAKFDAIGVSTDATILRVMPTVDPRTRTVELVAEIPNPDFSLRPGLLAEVQIGGIEEATAAGGAP